MKLRITVLLVLGALVGTALLELEPATEPDSQTVSARDIRVIDGDTIDINGDRVRLMGFNTPETRFAECAAERALGDKATERLLSDVRNAASLDIEYKQSRNGTRTRDRYDRFLGVLRIDGRDVSETMIAAGLAEPYGGGQRRSWCQ